MSKYQRDSLHQLRNRIMQTDPLKVVLGAGELVHPVEWICTNVDELDVTEPADWNFLFMRTNRVDFVFCEHVWEHFTEDQAIRASKNVFDYMKPGGNFRIAVPDGNFPDQSYIDKVKPGGTGAGALDHKMLWTYRTLGNVLTDAGFEIDLLEFWDSGGKFHCKAWEDSRGKTLRSIKNDERNIFREGSQEINYTSLIIDAIKP